MATCNQCGFLIPTEREEDIIKTRFHYIDTDHKCTKFDVSVHHKKGDCGFGAPIYPCAMCNGNPIELMEG